MSRTRRYVATPSIEDGNVTYGVNCVDQHLGFFPVETIGSGMTLEEAKQLAALLNEGETAPPDAPKATTKSKSWWAS